MIATFVIGSRCKLRTCSRTWIGFVIFAENFSVNLQAIRERLSWGVAVEACFNDLEKRAGAAQLRAAREAQCSRVT